MWNRDRVIVVQEHEQHQQNLTDSSCDVASQRACERARDWVDDMVK